MGDADRELAAAFARKLADCAAADPDVTARELVAIAKGRGYRHVIIPPPPPDGPGLPDPDGRELAALRAARGWQ